MLIAAALIELALPQAESIKARRRVAQAVKARLRQRFNVSVAELGDPDDRHSVCVGCVTVGINPVHLRQKLDKAVRFVESLGLAELVGDDILVARLDELDEVETDDLDDGNPDDEPFGWEEE
jgi:uncharacterized protein YlxP (DUF503 family)